MFYDTIRSQILRRLHQHNPSIRPALKEAEVLFKPPQVISGSDGNTTVTLQVRSLSKHYTGNLTVTYTRWYLAYFMFGLSIPGKPGDYLSTRAAMTALIDKYHLPMTATDVLDTPLNSSMRRITLTASPDSLAVYGQSTNIRFDEAW